MLRAVWLCCLISCLVSFEFGVWVVVLVYCIGCCNLFVCWFSWLVCCDLFTVTVYTLLVAIV